MKRLSTGSVRSNHSNCCTKSIRMWCGQFRNWNEPRWSCPHPEGVANPEAFPRWGTLVSGPRAVDSKRVAAAVLTTTTQMMVILRKCQERKTPKQLETLTNEQIRTTPTRKVDVWFRDLSRPMNGSIALDSAPPQRQFPSLSPLAQ